MFDKLLHVRGTLQMAIEIYVANPSSFKRDWSFSLSRGREDIRGGRRKGGATFFPEEGDFHGAWVKSLQCDCISVHEKSVPHMPPLAFTTLLSQNLV